MRQHCVISEGAIAERHEVTRRLSTTERRAISDGATNAPPNIFFNIRVDSRVSTFKRESTRMPDIEFFTKMAKASLIARPVVVLKA